jgi:hypothetical protein
MRKLVVAATMLMTMVSIGHATVYEVYCAKSVATKDDNNNYYEILFDDTSKIFVIKSSRLTLYNVNSLNVDPDYVTVTGSTRIGFFKVIFKNASKHIDNQDDDDRKETITFFNPRNGDSATDACQPPIE